VKKYVLNIIQKKFNTNIFYSSFNITRFEIL